MPPTAYEKGKLYDLPIGDLNPDPNQPRKSMDPQALEDLSASITQHGVLTPVLFRVAPATTQSSALSPQSSALSPQHSVLSTMFLLSTMFYVSLSPQHSALCFMFYSVLSTQHYLLALSTCFQHSALSFSPQHLLLCKT
ncbi:MAG: ParB N-terminal domain-containing protein [Proteobacteria bacterium]|nr:ParB N-terminal domain-containing protein [Pseudomonadota bacterium]